MWSNSEFRRRLSRLVGFAAVQVLALALAAVLALHPYVRL
ncbi:MAG: hypothetical protein JWP43_1773 [Ramlibacter sp.]|jgi:hypothetical protein|nr:hypothetical protein [Ramlibacter sp.]